MRIKFIFVLLVFLISVSYSQTVTMGLLHRESENLPGFVLFAPVANTTTYLIDKCGYYVHSWNSTYRPGLSVYLLEDGTLLRTGNAMNPDFAGGGGSGGVIEKIDWNGNILWSFQYSDSNHCQHHDINPMPNGNVLLITWELKTRNQAIAAGRDSTFLNAALWDEEILEIQPVGTNSANLIWKWRSWDHLIQDIDSTKANFGIVSQHPELIDINANPLLSSNEDWLHLNSVEYDPVKDQILISSRIYSEIWVLDHSTSTLEAASHTGGNMNKGGDLLFRWGNPRMYQRGSMSDQKFFGQHSACRIPTGMVGEGDIMVFNNGKDRIGGNYSSVDIIHPSMDPSGNYILDPSGLPFGPASAGWSYVDSVPAHFYSNNLSGAQRLANGHTLICNGNNGTFFEIDSTGHTVWRYKNPVNGLGPATQGSAIVNNNVFRTVFYEESYPGFSGHALAGYLPIELDPVSYFCNMPLELTIEPSESSIPSVFPNPFVDKMELEFVGTSGSICKYQLFDLSGKVRAQGLVTAAGDISLPNLRRGMYILQLEINGKVFRLKVVKVE